MRSPEAEILTDGIAAAMKAHDFSMVVSQLKTLAVIDPEQARAVWDVIQLGIEIRREAAG
jgi:hypothetical protein